ncbi:MAG: mechanosensitive ion channel [Candidatus Aenigmarchaeota archaeon]|nr:mechanosensitive ion channel [Candidatus Aenigmarchaeota archaeon]
MAFELEGFLNYAIWNNSVKDYLGFLAVFILILFASRFFKYELIKRLKKIALRTKSEFDDLVIKIIEEVGWPFYILLSLYVALNFIRIPDFIDKIFYYAVPVVVTYYVVKSIHSLIDYGTQKLILEKQEEADLTVTHLLSRILKGILWGIAIVLLLSNFGYNVTTLIAGLGILGIAIAFGLQHVLSDIFASFSIYFDKPFEVGDFIIVGDNLGVVQKIGIKSTRLQSLWGQEVVLSNKELTSTRINNYKKMERRRIHFTFGVVYNTSTKKLKRILEITKDIFENIDLADLDRVHFKEYGDFSLNFEVAYYVNTGDYNRYMDTQQEINLALKERFEKEGIEFAYPTQTILVNKK